VIPNFGGDDLRLAAGQQLLRLLQGGISSSISSRVLGQLIFTMSTVRPSSLGFIHSHVINHAALSSESR
jgi:hypothetical protein